MYTDIHVHVANFSFILLIVVTVNLCVFQEFETNGSYDTEKSRTTGSLKTKLRFQDKGMVGIN